MGWQFSYLHRSEEVGWVWTLGIMRVSGDLGRVASAVLIAVSGCTRRESDNKRQAVPFPFPNSNTVCSFPILYNKFKTILSTHRSFSHSFHICYRSQDTVAGQPCSRSRPTSTHYLTFVRLPENHHVLLKRPRAIYRHRLLL